MQDEEAVALVLSAIGSVTNLPTDALDLDAPLLGGAGNLDSMGIVEVCVSVEDALLELGVSFDWSSESAMSRSRSVFRTARTLAAEVKRQSEEGA